MATSTPEETPLASSPDSHGSVPFDRSTGYPSSSLPQPPRPIPLARSCFALALDAAEFATSLEETLAGEDPPLGALLLQATKLLMSTATYLSRSSSVIASLSDDISLLQTTVDFNATESADLRDELSQLSKICLRLSSEPRSSHPAPRAAREVVDPSKIKKLGFMHRPDLHRSWLKEITALARVLKLPSIDDLPLDYVLSTLTGSCKTSIEARMDSDAVLGKKEITSKELLSLIANRVHKSDSSAESCLSAYKSVSPPRGSTFYDLAALYTRALVSILRSSPRNLPLPREHIRTLHNSLPTSAQASLLSVRSAVTRMTPLRLLPRRSCYSPSSKLRTLTAASLRT